MPGGFVGGSGIFSRDNRIVLFFGFAIAVLVTLAYVSFQGVDQFDVSAAAIRESQLRQDNLATAAWLFGQAESQQRAYIATEDAPFLARFEAAKAPLQSKVLQVDGFLRTSPDSLKGRELIRLLRYRIAHLDSTIHIAEIDIGDARRRLDVGAVITDSIYRAITDLRASEAGNLQERLSAADATADLTRGIVIAGGILSALMLALATGTTVRDLRARRRAEAALGAQEHMLSQFFDSLPMAVFVLDEKGRPWFQNRSSVELLGEGKEGLGPQQLAIAYNAYVAGTDDVYPAHEVIARTLHGETVTLTDVEFEQGGRRVPVELRAAPVRDEAGRVTHALAAVMDITERKRAERELMTARNAAEGANRAKSQFLARMSHELRTPLNSVIGFATILRKDKSANHSEQQALYLDRIIANGKHLLALINDVLDLSKVEAGRMDLEKSPVQVDQVIRDVVQSFEGQARERGLTIDMDLPDRVATVETDLMRFKQVLINLIGNALKFTERGGVEVRLVVEPESDLPKRIEVEDTGVGIHPNRLGAIFQAFEQGERSTTRKFGGSGLGLSISQALCDLLGWRIEVRSEMGVGSTFTLLLDGVAPLPARKGELPADAAGSEPPRTLRRIEKAKRVLVVDDEADSRMLLAHQLEELGYEPLAAPTGEDGIRAARALAPDVILLDLKMPGMSGWEVIRKLKTERDLARIPVVVVSVVAAENRGSVIGALEYLNKPVAREDLFEVLKRVLPNGGHGVLVVDDDEDMQRLLSDELSADYGPVWTAGDGEEALGLLRSLAPDVILLDLVMPGMDGFTFLERLRMNPRFAHTPVIVVSSKDLTRAEQEELAKRTTALVGKGEDLAERVRGAIERALANPAEAL